MRGRQRPISLVCRGLALLAGAVGCAHMDAAPALDLQPARQFLAEGARLEKQGNLSRAASAYRSAMANPVLRPTAMTNLANVMAADGRHDEAVVLYRKALTLEWAAPTLNNLAWLLVVTGGDLFEAAALAGEGAKAADDDVIRAYCWHTAGLANALAGDGKQAIECLTRALSDASKGDEAFRRRVAVDLARYLMLDGRSAEAQTVLSRFGTASDSRRTSVLTQLRSRARYRMRAERERTR